MKSESIGSATSEVEVTNVSSDGFWIAVHGRKHFLSLRDFPWFAKATVEQLFDVELHHQSHLYWPKLDIDLELGSIVDPAGGAGDSISKAGQLLDWAREHPRLGESEAARFEAELKQARANLAFPGQAWE